MRHYKFIPLKTNDKVSVIKKLREKIDPLDLLQAKKIVDKADLK